MDSHRTGSDACRKKKLEFTAVEKVQICDDFKVLVSSSPTKERALQELRKKLDLSSERLRDILNNEDEWRKIVRERRLGEGGFLKKGVKPGSISRLNRGVRRSGGGRKRQFEAQVRALGQWISQERSHGHALQKAFIGRKFQELLLQGSEELLQSTKEMTEPFQIVAAKIEARSMWEKVQKMRKSDKYSSAYVKQLLKWTGAKCMKKELSTSLSPLEEKVRIQLSWQSLDWQLWLAGSAPLETLEEEGVLDPQHVIECRKMGPPSVCFADQIPLWAKCSSKHFVFSAEEFSGSSTSDRAQFDLFRQDLQRAAEYFRDQEDKHQLVSAESRPEGSRAFAIAGSRTVKCQGENDKFRITYEARQQVSWVADPSVPGGFRPVGSVLKPLVVFAGAGRSREKYGSAF